MKEGFIVKRLWSRKACFNIIRVSFVLAILLGIVCFTVPEARADVYYVKQGSSGDGSEWSKAFGDLQSGLDAADSGDEIWVAAGAYYPTSDHGLGIGDRGKHFKMKNGVGIYGGFAGTETARGQRNWNSHVTILSGDIGNENDASDNCYHVIFNYPEGLDGTATIDGFTITGGNANHESEELHRSGGGFYNSSASITVSNCVIRGNSAGNSGNGGGMCNSYSDPTITDCVFENNTSDYMGGGILNEDSNPTVTNCRFENNAAAYGGGMDSYSNSNPIITNCAFIRNTAFFDGGGSGGGFEIYRFSTLKITNCEFIENSADSGGGLTLDVAYSPPDVVATITNCLFVGNSSTGGGGIQFIGKQSEEDVQLINSTFNGNSAVRGGGMIMVYNASPAIKNTILWGNSATEKGPEICITDYLPGNPTFSYCDIAGSGGSEAWNMAMGTDGGENIDADPQFVDASSGDLHLPSGSPCIDTGDNGAVPAGVATDLDGNGRIVDGTVDRGCYEYQSVSPVPPAQGIPTLSEWGIIIFALLTASAAIVFLRRKKITA